MVKDLIKQISLHIVGRLFKPKVFQGILYEVHKYNSKSGEVILRRMYD
ncbi:MAG: hypothetical protein ACK521_04145 [bacterium]